MWQCKHCEEEFNFIRATEKANHTRHCNSNPRKDNSYINVRKKQKEYFDLKLGDYKNYTITCDRCESLFDVKEREKLFPEKEKYFCSRKCANSTGGQAKSIKYHNDDNASYSVVCWRHHNKICLVCGEKNIVAVHHMNENHDDNDPKNLVPLCPTHHQYMHSRHKELIINKVLEYINNRWKNTGL